MTSPGLQCQYRPEEGGRDDVTGLAVPVQA
jgi:hypothetical protein